jgi:hypothetical protein
MKIFKIVPVPPESRHSSARRSPIVMEESLADAEHHHRAPR